MKVVTFVESLPTEFTALKVPVLCVPKDAAGKLYILLNRVLDIGVTDTFL